MYMNSVFVVSKKKKGVKILCSLVKEAVSVWEIQTASTANQAREYLEEHDCDLTVIDSPLSDEAGFSLACETAEKTNSACIVIARQDADVNVLVKLEEKGIAVISKPINKEYFFRTVRVVNSLRKRYLGIYEENERLQDELETVRLANRAKCALIQYLRMTEKQAHRYLEKQAMDMRMTIKDTALQIIKTYET